MKILLSYPLAMPFQVSQRWGENAAYYAQMGLKGHNGWDFSIPTGTPVYATHDGTVFSTMVDSTGANEILLDSVGGTFRTFYAHLSEFKVTSNDRVKKGQLIGLSGNTGRYTTGPHLHFGVHPIANFSDTEKDNGYNGAVDPAKFWDGTYPSAVPTNNDVSNFIAALTKYQIARGIKPYPKIGPSTTLALKKDNLL